jgi:uncharacterized protein YodC (DUF2158 family)
MTEAQQLFRKGDKVQHKLGEQKMIVDYYEIEDDDFFLPGPDRQLESPQRYTGKVYCNWVTKDNNRQTELFNEHELVPVV